MKSYKITCGNREYFVSAKDSISAIRKLRDEMSGLEDKVRRYAQAVADYKNKGWDKNLDGKFDYIPKISKGPKYYKVILKSGSSDMVVAFVDMDGNVYKPASWNAPASGIRGHIDTIDPCDTLYRY